MQVLSFSESSDGLCHAQCGLPVIIAEQPGVDTGRMVWKSDTDERLLQHLLVFSQEIRNRRFLFNLHNGFI